MDRDYYWTIGDPTPAAQIVIGITWQQYTINLYLRQNGHTIKMIRLINISTEVFISCLQVTSSQTYICQGRDLQSLPLWFINGILQYFTASIFTVDSLRINVNSYQNEVIFFWKIKIYHLAKWYPYMQFLLWRWRDIHLRNCPLTCWQYAPIL